MIEGKSALTPLLALDTRPPDVTQRVATFKLTCEVRDLSEDEETHRLASTAVPAARDPAVYADAPRPPATTVKLTDPIDPTLLLPDFPDIKGAS